MVRLQLRRRSRLRRPWLALLLATLPGLARADSSLELPLQPAFGALPAGTYDEETMLRIGDAQVSLTRLPNDNLLLTATSAIRGADAIVVMSELERYEDGRALRPVWQESHSWDSEGRSRGIMWVDHRAARALCTAGEGEDDPAVEIAIPQPDLIANVPMHLVFLPLLSGEKKEVSFQFFTCRGHRIVSAKARIARRTQSSDEHALIEVRSELDLGPVLTPLARALLPRFSFWFDMGDPERWIGHRMPLGTGGPQVLIVRTGVPVRELTAPQ